MMQNKRMFTLQHIWDMMNSSTPLENVMEAIVNSTQGELGYMHCAIIRKCADENGVNSYKFLHNLMTD